MWRPILSLAWAEVLHIARDRATLFEVIFIPLVQLLILTNAATFQIRNIPAYVVDLDHTPASRGLADRFSASGHFRVVETSESAEAANEALLRGDVTMVLTIPSDFSSSLMRTSVSSVQLMMNAEKGSAAGIVQFYALGITGKYAEELTRQHRATPQVVRLGVAPSTPTVSLPRIDVRVRSWYNPTLEYKHFMVPGILVMLITLIGTLLAAQNLAREKELGTLEQLNVTPMTNLQFVIAKLLPLWVLAMGEFAIGLLLGKIVFGTPIEGSLLLLFAVTAIYLTGTLGIGFWMSTIVHTQQQAMFVTFFISIFYFLLSGLFTPTDSMPQFVQWISQINPVRHFVEIVRAILLKGAGLSEIMRPLSILVATMVIILWLTVRQSTKRAT